MDNETPSIYPDFVNTSQGLLQKEPVSTTTIRIELGSGSLQYTTSNKDCFIKQSQCLWYKQSQFKSIPMLVAYSHAGGTDATDQSSNIKNYYF